MPITTSNATSPASTSYNGDQVVNDLDSPDGQTIQLNIPGSQVFPTGGSNSAIQGLNNLIADDSKGTAVHIAPGFADPQLRLELSLAATRHDRSFTEPALVRFGRSNEQRNAIDGSAGDVDAG